MRGGRGGSRWVPPHPPGSRNGSSWPQGRPVRRPTKVEIESTLVGAAFVRVTLLLIGLMKNFRWCWGYFVGLSGYCKYIITVLLRWVGRRGPVHWPARSPDLNPLDYYRLFTPLAVRRHEKCGVFYAGERHQQLATAYQQRLCSCLYTTQVSWERPRQSLMGRCHASIAARGGHFEHPLKVGSNRERTIPNNLEVLADRVRITWLGVQTVGPRPFPDIAQLIQRNIETVDGPILAPASCGIFPIFGLPDGKIVSNSWLMNDAAPECKCRENGGIPEKSPPTSGIVRHDSHMRKSGGDPAENRTRLAQMEGELSNPDISAASIPFCTANSIDTHSITKLHYWQAAYRNIVRQSPHSVGCLSGALEVGLARRQPGQRTVAVRALDDLECRQPASQPRPVQLDRPWRAAAIERAGRPVDGAGQRGGEGEHIKSPARDREGGGKGWLACGRTPVAAGAVGRHGDVAACNAGPALRWDCSTTRVGGVCCPSPTPGDESPALSNPSTAGGFFRSTCPATNTLHLRNPRILPRTYRSQHPATEKWVTRRLCRLCVSRSGKSISLMALCNPAGLAGLFTAHRQHGRLSNVFLYPHSTVPSPTTGAAVAEQLACSPPAKAIQVQSPGWVTPNFRMWESCRTTVCRRVFSGISRFPPTFHSGRCSILTSITLIYSQDLDVNSRPNLFTLHPQLVSRHTFFGMARAIEPMRVKRDEYGANAGMKGRGKREIPEETPPTSSIVQHDSHMRRSGSPAGNRIHFA
ncbi:hypothetical protein PR048_003316 [Dryococelus australis]|uniref:Uncharacterized protein n=1 Tax=Dryococelus australis TaxID=614101 RepID=A0ABQ9IMR3_9NEOP|nr:hypothetical protein PR048_003316 [Dryococelus australis]